MTREVFEKMDKESLFTLVNACEETLHDILVVSRNCHLSYGAQVARCEYLSSSHGLQNRIHILTLEGIGDDMSQERSELNRYLTGNDD